MHLTFGNEFGHCRLALLLTAENAENAEFLERSQRSLPKDIGTMCEFRGEMPELWSEHQMHGLPGLFSEGIMLEMPRQE